jgi:hypothetical protein
MTIESSETDHHGGSMSRRLRCRDCPQPRNTPCL